MKKRKVSASKSMQNSRYGMALTFKFSKSRVICAIIEQIIGYLLWVFYSAYFVRFVIHAIEEERPFGEVLINLSVIGGVSLLLQAYQYLCDDVIFPTQDIVVYQKMYQKIYQKSENVELACFENTNFYNKFSIALDGIGAKLGENVDNISQIIGGILGGILAFWAMIEIDPCTIIFLAAPLIGNFVLAPQVNKIRYCRYKDSVPYDRRIGYVNRVMYLEKYAKELRLYHIFNVLKKILDDATKQKSQIWKKYFHKAFWIGMAQFFFSYFIIFEGILLYGAYRALVATTNKISFGEMAVLSSVMITASWVCLDVINAYNRNYETGLVISDLKEFLEYKEKIPEDQQGISPSSEVESIEFRNVSFTYDGTKNVIEDLSFTLHRGNKVALVGYNGAGKTTIIKLLLRLYDPTAGVILVNDIDIREYNLKEYRSLFLCALQDYEIFAGTVKENVLLGRDATDSEVEEALKKAGVYEKVMQLPKGIHTMLTKEFDQEGALLSGGEFQKIICARVFVDQTKVSVFDEPSSALDPIAENELFDSIIDSIQNRIGIIISHRLSSVKEADYVYMLEQGRIIEQGSHEELMELNGSYAKMYKVQERNYYTFDEESLGDCI